MANQGKLWPERPRRNPSHGRVRRALDEQVKGADLEGHKLAAARSMADAVDQLSHRIRDTPEDDKPPAYAVNVLSGAMAEYRATCDWLLGVSDAGDDLGEALRAFTAADASAAGDNRPGPVPGH